ncbi:MAG TPA: antibiotic biosynthesis monooxygenase [Saprospiraceae bacterium]|nr:antibiotic biosynthesis monooxygenase [Saprospiraceae bacterium]HND88855.1 antibiotic biosynthesis monooxygenase [Saprospiraceae bacterium]
MIKRIVRMTFRPEAVETFRNEVFEQSKQRIRAFPGCLHMELLQEAGQPHILFTLSLWESEDALDTYRRSELFRSTWERTKAGFADKPQAWSAEVLDTPDT